MIVSAWQEFAACIMEFMPYDMGGITYHAILSNLMPDDCQCYVQYHPEAMRYEFGVSFVNQFNVKYSSIYYMNKEAIGSLCTQ